MLIYPLDGKTPRVAEGAFVAPTAVLVGDVEVEAGASVWFGAVLRGDLGHIHVSSGASVQDNVVVHTLPGGKTHIGPDATVAHGTILHNCQVGMGAVVGVGCVVLDDAVIGEQAMVAAGSVVRERFHVPPRHLAAGVPAEVKKELGGQALDWVQTSAAAYRELTARYLAATAGGGGCRLPPAGPEPAEA